MGGRLAAALADRGWDVRCLVRDRSRAKGLADRGFELHEADVLDADALGGAGEGVEVAYYLIHAMGRGARGDFEERERESARNFAEMAKREGLPGSSTWAGLVTARGRRTCAAGTEPPRSSPSWGRRSPTSAPG